MLLDDHLGHNKGAALVLQSGKELGEPNDWVINLNTDALLQIFGDVPITQMIKFHKACAIF